MVRLGARLSLVAGKSKDFGLLRSRCEERLSFLQSNFISFLILPALCLHVIVARLGKSNGG